MRRRSLVGVRRLDGPAYLLIMIVAFSITVIAVRVYLDWAGYPKIGGGGLHVAHMLWGGLLLVVAALITQLWVGRRSRIIGAAAAGIGVGLFIDEVGKFITETNDYFFAPAAPIIYGSILLLALAWLRLRRSGPPSTSEAVAAAASAVQDLADERLSAADRDRAVADLQLIRTGSGAEQALAARLAGLLGAPEVEQHLRRPNWWERREAQRWLRRLLPDRLERMLIRVGLLVTALGALVGVLVALVILTGQLPDIEAPAGPIEYPTEPLWILVLAGVWISVGLGCGVALAVSLTGRHLVAMAIAQHSVTFSLVAGGLLSVYLSQLQALSGILLTFGLLLLILDQRARLAD